MELGLLNIIQFNIQLWDNIYFFTLMKNIMLFIWSWEDWGEWALN